jgi:hypothetical protein
MNFAQGLMAAGAIVSDPNAPPPVTEEDQAAADARWFAEYMKMQCTPNGTAFQVIEDQDPGNYRQYARERFQKLLEERLYQTRETMEANLVKNLYSKRR